MEDHGDYHPRLIDKQLQAELETYGAVLITGPKWCGKSTTAEQIAMSAIYLQDPDNRERYHQIATIKISDLLIGDNPRLIDEWQMEPNLWDAVRFSIDRRHQKGLYILTGSVKFKLPNGSHSGAGRIDTLRMDTLTLFESGDSNGDISLSSLFDGATGLYSLSPHTISDITRIIVRGGWPEAVYNRGPLNPVKGYCEAILNSELKDDAPDRDREKLKRVMASISRNISTPVTLKTIAKDALTDMDGIDQDMSDDEIEEVSAKSVGRYIGDLVDVCVIDYMPAWMPKLRSQARVRTRDTLYLCDPAIAAYFLKASPMDLEMDPETLGLLFECLVARDLRVYAQALGGNVYRYHDSTELEVDMIVHLDDGRWGAIEVKLSDGQVEKGVQSLKKLKDKVDIEERNKLSFMAVITATGVARTRDDGIHVIPIGCLRE